MNFAYLAGFQAIEFVDQPVPKMIDILFVRWLYKALFFPNFLHESEHSIYYIVHEELAHDKQAVTFNLISNFHLLH